MAPEEKPEARTWHESTSDWRLAWRCCVAEWERGDESSDESSVAAVAAMDGAPVTLTPSKAPIAWSSAGVADASKRGRYVRLVHRSPAAENSNSGSQSPPEP